MFSKSKPCLTGLFIEESLRVKKVLFSTALGICCLLSAKGFSWTCNLNTLTCWGFFSPLWANLWGLTLCVLGSRDNGLLWMSSPEDSVTEVRNVTHLLSLLHSLAASGRCSRPAWLGYVLQNGRMFCWQHSREVCSWIFWELTVWLKLKWTGLSDKSLCWWNDRPSNTVSSRRTNGTPTVEGNLAITIKTICPGFPFPGIYLTDILSVLRNDMYII